MNDAGVNNVCVTVKEPTESANAGGDTVVEFFQLKIPTWYAQMRPLGGNESAVSDAIEGRRTWRFTGRYRADITSAMQLLWEGRTFEIQYVEDGGARTRELTVVAIELV